MGTQETIAQIIGIFALSLNVLSFQQKSKKTLITIQLLGSLAFCIHFLLLGAYTGFILNFIGIGRATVYANKEKFKADSPLWLIGFTLLYAATYILVFTVFGKEPILRNFVLELLPVISMVISTAGFRTKNAATVRKLSLFYCPLWLIYNICIGSIGGILCETICLISITIAIIRLDLKNKN